MAPCDASFKKEVRLTCYEALAHQGFVRFRKENVDWPFENGFHCWVGLNTALYAEHVEINPFCGVHCVPIERLSSSIERGEYARKYERGIATYGLHLGEIAPTEKVFRFRRDTDLKTQAHRLADLYVRVGLSFAKSLASYETLLGRLKERVEMLGGNPQRVACCLFLMGRLEEARFFVEGFLAGREEYFEGFAVPFLKMIEAGGAAES